RGARDRPGDGAVSAAMPRALSLRLPIAASAAAHAIVVAAFLLVRGAPSIPAPPMYRVSLIAAPPGPRQTGIVQPPAASAPTPATVAPTPAAPARSTPDPSRMPPLASRTKPRVRTKPVKSATPVAGDPQGNVKAAPAPAPAAGGGPQGGRGADVANVRVDGIEFPYPGYLQNVVRQIAVNFKPSRGGVTAVVAFLIRRDGSVTGIRLTTRSGVYSFDTEAMGAVEAAARSFGPLPAGFPDDVLPVIFSFDPRLIR
ncbi:MAG: TonB family protein, partial [Gemmatimonadaceae bacterium]